MKSVDPFSKICSTITQEKLINSSPADGLHSYLNNTKLINIESHNPWGSRRLIIGGIDFPLADFLLYRLFSFRPSAGIRVPHEEATELRAWGGAVESVYCGLED